MYLKHYGPFNIRRDSIKTSHNQNIWAVTHKDLGPRGDCIAVSAWGGQPNSRQKRCQASRQSGCADDGYQRLSACLYQWAPQFSLSMSHNSDSQETQAIMFSRYTSGFLQYVLAELEPAFLSQESSFFSLFATQGGKQASSYFRQRNWVQAREAQIRFPAG